MGSNFFRNFRGIFKGFEFFIFFKVNSILFHYFIVNIGLEICLRRVNPSLIEIIIKSAFVIWDKIRRIAL
jgi:hypothetical protein